ncbi:hypothetical protein ON010_g6273 [Phytophthora cinnamomi]|nr:hypothetical protein ON010_g6273 [Phytophthora cinnamomi]
MLAKQVTRALRRAAVWLLRSLVEFPDVLDKSGVMGPDTKREMMEVLASIILQLSNEKVSNFVSANGQAGEAIKFKKAAAIAPWRIFEINTGKPAPNDIAVVRFVREVDETTVEVMDVDVNFETGENMVFQAKKADMRPLQVVDDAIGEDDELEDEETDLLDEQVLTLCDSCWALVEMTLHDSDVVGGISSVILAPVLRLLGNIVSAEISFSQAVIDAKLLEVIPSVMTTTSRAVREEACWMLSNIAGGQEEQVVAMMNAPGVINGLVEQMAWAEYGVKREATWAMCNIIVRANLDFIKEAVRMGVLQSFCPLLDEWEDPMVELVILEAIESLLQKDPQEGRIAVEESGCLEKIEELCYDQNEDVSGMASQLIDTWFDNAGDEADATLAPAVVGSEQTGEALNFQPVQGDVQFNFNQMQSPAPRRPQDQRLHVYGAATAETSPTQGASCARDTTGHIVTHGGAQPSIGDARRTCIRAAAMLAHRAAQRLRARRQQVAARDEGRIRRWWRPRICQRSAASTLSSMLHRRLMLFGPGQVVVIDQNTAYSEAGSCCSAVIQRQ